MKPDRMALSDLLRDYKVGSADWSWRDESRDLWMGDPDVMVSLVNSISEHGVRVPVLLGSDSRVWDGHHRIIAAVAALVPDIPVEYGHETSTRCFCDGESYELRRNPFLVHPRCPVHGTPFTGGEE